MRWVRIGLIGTGVTVAAIAIVVVLLITVDLGRFKPQVETLVSNLAGRRIHIDGIFQPSVGSEIRLIVEDIHIDNPDWASGDSLIKAQRLDVSLDTWALFSGKILLGNIEVNEIAIALEQDESGANNWTLFESDPEEAEDDSDSTLDLLIRQVRIRDLGVTYVEPGRDSPLRLQVSAIDQVQLDSGDLQLELDGDINGTPVTLDATAGSFANLLAAGQVHYDLRGVIGEVSINSKAQIDNLAEPRKPVGQLEISGPNATYLTDVLGIAPITRGPLNLVATMKPVADLMKLKIQGAFGEFEIDVLGSFSDLQDFDDASIDFSAKGPDAATFAELTGLDGIPADPYSIRGTVRGKGEATTVGSIVVQIGDTEFDANATVVAFPDIDGSVVSVKIDGPEFGRFNKLLGLPGKLTGPFSLTADLSQSPQGEELLTIVAAAQDIHVGVSGVVSTAPDFVGTELALTVNGDDLSVIGEVLDIADIAAVPFKLNAGISRAERGFAIDKGVVNLGADVLRVDGLVGIEPLQRDTDLRFQAVGPDLAGTLKMVGMELENLPPESYELAGEIRREADYFELDEITARLGSARARLSGQLGNLTDFQGTEISITIEGDSLAALVPADSGLVFQAVPFSVASELELAGDELNINELEVRIGAGELQGNVSIGMAPMLASGNVQITAKGPNVAEWIPAFDQYMPAITPFGLAGDVRWQDDHVIVDHVSVEVGKGQLVASGTVDAVDFARTDLNLDASFASLSRLGRIAGTELPDQPLTFSVHLIGSDNRLQLENLRAKVAKSDLSGSAIYERQGEVPFVEVNLTSNHLNLVPFLPRKEDGATPEVIEPAADARVIPDTPIPMDLLQQLNGKVDISVAELVLRESTVSDVLLKGSLQSGALRIEKFGVVDQRGTLAGSAEVLPTAGEPRITAAIEGTGLTLGLTPSSPDAVNLLPHYDFQLKLAADGATVRDMAASLDGTLRLVGGSGQVKGMPGWFARDFAAEIVGTVNPFSKQESFTRIECVAVLLRSVDGQIDGQPALVLQTDKLNILGVAFIDLGTEKMDAKFETAARTGLGVGMSDFITPFTKVSGTLARPELSVDPEQAVAQGGMAALTLGASFIAKKLKSRYFSPKDPCGKSVAEADAEMKATSG